MPSEVTPESLRRAQFRITLRGLDKSEVESTLESAASEIESLSNQLEKLKAQLEDKPGSNLETEFEHVGREVSAILQSAREAADAMRERATADAARWRSEAMEEAETVRKEAAADAEALRRDAWVSGSEALEQATTEAARMRAEAERDVLTVMGEAEREAHRLTSGARREAEDLTRNASMEAEKVLSDATSRRDDIIDAANRQASAAQERTRALEQRRDELLEELENVRSTLTRLEGSLQERREALDLSASEPSSVKVVHPPADAKQHWELGETVRVVPPDHSGPEDPDPRVAEDVSAEVAALRQDLPQQDLPQADEEAEELSSQSSPPDAVEPASPQLESVEIDDTEEPERAEEVASSGDDVGQLFASLRSGSGEAPASAGDDATAAEAHIEPSDSSSGDAEPDQFDWVEEREARLIPITNRALRGVKKAMTEVQNVALDSLRTDDEWRPDTKQIADSMHAEIVAVWSESFAAGHQVAEQISNVRIKRPPTPQTKADIEFAGELAAAVSAALEGAGDSARDRQSAASRVFRVWRSDEAERKLRSLALDGYQAGLDSSRSVSSDV